MKKTLKWSGIGILGLCVMIIGALLLIPMLVDIQDHKPRLEALVSDHTGREFKIGGDIKLSLFPWGEVALTDLTIGNPEGYQQKNFVFIKSFDVQVRLLPLITGNVEVKSFVIDGFNLTLERSATGKGNWEGLGGNYEIDGKKSPQARDRDPQAGLPLKSLHVGECAIRDGIISLIDHRAGTSRTLSNLNLDLQDVSLDEPIRLSLFALFDGRPLAVAGSFGPLGSAPGAGPVAINLMVKAFNHLDLDVQGWVTPASGPKIDMSFQLSPFSPRRLFKDLSESFPIQTADSSVLDKIALKGSIKGSTEKFSITDGQLILDDSWISFRMDVRELAKPVVSFDIKINSINLDRYKPPPKNGSDASAFPETGNRGGSGLRKKPEAGIDYAPLRTPVLRGSLSIENLTAQKAKLSNLNMKIASSAGRYELDPVSLKAYDGTLMAKALFDVRKEKPTVSVDLKAKNIQVQKLFQELMYKDFMEGALEADIELRMSGDDPSAIRKTLNGKGELLLKDGSIVGVNMVGMVRNVISAFSLSEKPAERLRTDFSELKAPFTITNGLVSTAGTTMQSPLLRLLVTGDADLVTENLSMRVEPKLVATLKGQGDTIIRSGIVVPVIVSGTFSEPKFQPDLKGILTQGVELPKAEDFRKLEESVKDSAKELLKKLPFGR